MRPWNTEEISRVRRIRYSVILESIGAYYKIDMDYQPLGATRKSIRVQVRYQGRDVRFIADWRKVVQRTTNGELFKQRWRRCHRSRQSRFAWTPRLILKCLTDGKVFPPRLSRNATLLY